MTYCTEAQLTAATGSLLGSTILTEVLAAGDREMVALLGKHGLAGGGGDIITQAAVHLCSAILIDRGLQTGDYGATAGKAEDAALHRRVADEMVGTYAAQSTSSKNTIRVYKVNR